MILRKMGLLGVMMVGSAWLGGCCQCGKPGGERPANLPPPITVEQQVQLLNDRAATIPFLLAHIDNMNMRYIDEKKKPQSVPIDSGSIVIRQQSGATDTGDITLTGGLLGQTQLELGKNQHQWWFAIFPQKRAQIGDLGTTPNLPDGLKDIFRADLHLQMLALGQVTPGPERVIAMEVDDVLGKNRVFVERTNSRGFARTERQIVVDRFTGRVEEVDIYDNAGSLLARSQLSDFKPVTYLPGATASPNPPTIPTKIRIDFPTLPATVEMTLSTLRIPPDISDDHFAPNDYQSEGLKVEHVGGS